MERKATKPTALTCLYNVCAFSFNLVPKFLIPPGSKTCGYSCGCQLFCETPKSLIQILKQVNSTNRWPSELENLYSNIPTEIMNLLNLQGHYNRTYSVHLSMETIEGVSGLTPPGCLSIKSLHHWFIRFINVASMFIWGGAGTCAYPSPIQLSFHVSFGQSRRLLDKQHVPLLCLLNMSKQSRQLHSTRLVKNQSKKCHSSIFHKSWASKGWPHVHVAQERARSSSLFITSSKPLSWWLVRHQSWPCFCVQGRLSHHVPPGNLDEGDEATLGPKEPWRSPRHRVWKLWTLRGLQRPKDRSYSASVPGGNPQASLGSMAAVSVGRMYTVCPMWFSRAHGKAHASCDPWCHHG